MLFAVILTRPHRSLPFLAAQVLAQSASAWKEAQLATFNVPSQPWVAREVAWHAYTLRAMLTYDDFFQRQILNQAGRLGTKKRPGCSRFNDKIF